MIAAHIDQRPLRVLGMGTALPGTPLTTAQLLKQIDERFRLAISGRGRAVARRLGVHTRHVARNLEQRHEAPRAGDTNAELAARAVRSALADANCDVSDVSYLIAHTATPGQLLPPGAAEIAERLSYAGAYVELRQACTGFANALVFAQSVLQAGETDHCARRVVVIVGSETGSVYFDPLRAAADDAQLINMLQMGDGAAAIVLASDTSNSANGMAPVMAASGTGTRIVGHFSGHVGLKRDAAFRLNAGGSNYAHQPQAPAEFEHDFDLIRRHGEQLFTAGIAAAAKMGVSVSEVDWIIPHQANGRMAQLLASELNLSANKIYVNADRVGNTGSAAIWLALAQLRAQLRGGERVLVLGAEATKFMYGGFLYEHGRT
jgi:3-oxoacyl-[acyl-carrier-protein] synthase-3